MSSHSHNYHLAPLSEESDIMTYIAIPRAEPSGAQNASESNELSQYLGVLRKRRKLIAASGCSLGFIAFLYCLLTPPSFTADTTIELRGHAPILASIQSENLFGSDSRKVEYLKTTVAKLKLTGLADAVLGRNHLDRDLHQYWISHRSPLASLWSSLRGLQPTISSASDKTTPHTGGYFQHTPSEISRYLSLIDVEPVHETNLVHIKATTTNKTLSQKIANLHATEFIEHLKRERQGAIQANVQLLRVQSDALRDKVGHAEEQLSSYAAANKLLLARNNDGNGLNHRHIESLAQMLADATGRRIKSESALQQAQRQKDDEGTFFDNEITQQLRATLKQSETEYASLGSQVTAAYPGMRELQAKITALRKAIRDERKQGIQSLQSQFTADLNAENALREQIEGEKAKAQDVARRLIHYDVLSKEASSLRDLYQAVLKQAKEIEMSASVATSNVFIADYAPLPTSPSAPKTRLIVILATLVGLSAGVMLAYILESLTDTITTPEDVHQTLDLPILGSIPDFALSAKDRAKALPHNPDHAGDAQGEPPSPSTPAEPTVLASDSSPNQPSHNPELITISAPQTAIAEALRTIRANVLLSSADYPPRVIMLASSVQGEGKTTILSNLAVTLAQANHRTLIIDGDLRIAGLTNLFCGTHATGPGLSELLTAQLPLEQVIYPTGVQHLDLLPVGARPPNPAELVGSESMKRLLAGLKERYDFILVDSPPVMAVADALLLSRMVDSILFVVRSGVTPRPIAREARNKLARVKARVIGIVLNGATEPNDRQKLVAYGSNYVSHGIN
jgi:succinoglycan biosynthesis transport protein ExoP